VDRPQFASGRQNARRAEPEYPQSALATQLSAVLRDQLISEIAALAPAEGALDWVRARMEAKNNLAVDDARIVETAFRHRMETLDPQSYSAAPIDSETTTAAVRRAEDVGIPAASSSAQAASPAELGPEKVQTATTSDAELEVSTNRAAARPRRYRDKEHLKFVAAQACVVCGREPSEAHHLRFAQPRALGRKVSDEFAVPLCRIHHREVHDHGDETAWWNGYNIKPMPIAFKLWQHTRGFVPVADGGNGSADKEKNRATAGGAATPDHLEATREGNAT
jgi:hypothetical protein